MAEDNNIFGQFNHLLGCEELTDDEAFFLKFCRGKIAARDFSTHKWYRDGGRLLTFPEFLDVEYRHETMTPRTRLVAIAEYLLSPVAEMLDGNFDGDYSAEKIVYRIDGELRRFAVRGTSLQPRDTRVNLGVVEEYCGANHIWELTEPILVATGLMLPDESKLGDLARKLANHELKRDFFAVYPSAR